LRCDDDPVRSPGSRGRRRLYVEELWYKLGEYAPPQPDR
jgi:hypothetical protein